VAVIVLFLYLFLQMSRYPRLQEKIEKIVKTHIRECEQTAKEQLLLQIKIQTSFSVLDLEDFTRFEK